MASLKETPRQKLIGLMYLVLLALLALQVSSAILYKFQSLNSSLEHFVQDSESRNQVKLQSISEQTKQRGKRPNEVEMERISQDIAQRTEDLIGYIESLKKTLIVETGGYEDNGDLKGAPEETQVEVLMLGASPGKGKAYELKKRLDEHVSFLNKTHWIKFQPMALDGKEDPMLQHHPDQRQKDFAELNFGQTPLVASLATLSEMEARLSTMKSVALTAISDSIGAGDYKFDRLVPMVRPNSKVVVAGTKYDAQLFMTATSSTQKPQMEAEGQKLTVDNAGMGKLSFTASGGNYNEDGFVKKTWKGRITLKQPNGKDTTYAFTEDYLVAKPTLRIQSGVIKALYRNCGNVLDIQVPSLGADYRPSIIATGSEVVTSDKKGVVTVIPKNPEAIVKVSSNGLFIGEEKYRVKLIPLPRIEARVRNRPINPIQGVGKDDLRFLTFQIIPDKEFAERLPRDARYALSAGKITLARLKTRVKEIDLKGANMSSIIGEANAGDRLVIEVTKVLRKNYKDEEETVNVAENIIIPIM